VASIVPVEFEGCIGWLHPAPGGRGVVLCSALAYEELCSRRTMHDLACAISAAGLPVLRFDYHGTADSAGSSEDPQRVVTWIANIGAAIDLIRRETGVEEVALVGLRLGALLAGCAAAERTDVSELALLAPPNSGRAYVRELRALSRLLVAPDADAARFDGLEVAGFRIARETLDELSQLEWPRGQRIGARRVLLMQPESATAKAVAHGLQAIAPVEHVGFEDYAGMMCDPTASVVPKRAIERVTTWTGVDAPGKPPKLITPHSPVLVGDTYIEAPAQFGDGGRLTGIFCRSLAGHQPRKAVVFVNAGAIYHVGWARMHVEMARELARSGIASLRFDLAGIGESAAPPGGEPLLYSAVSDDVGAAIDWLERQSVGDIAVFGSCSGAYQAFHAAISDRRIKSIALVNQLCFVWGPAYALQLEAWRRTKANELAARSDAQDANIAVLSARGLFARSTLVAKQVAKFVLRYAMDLIVRGQVFITRKNLVERWFEELCRRGTRVLLVYSDNDPGLIELERYMGPEGRRATALPGVTKHVIDNADHTFTPAEARRRLRHALHLFLVENTAGPAAAH
jgi:pimeloyl-ACP methyl ester carboxylesterase